MVKRVVEELEWIEDPVTTPAPSPPVEQFETVEQQTFKDRLVNKLSENVLVPLGLFATTACLTMGLVSMRRGDSNRQQIYMRGRVGAQLFTLVAMVGGMYYTQKRKANATK